MPNEQSSQARRANGTGALASLGLVVLLSSLGTSIANIALPMLGIAFDSAFQEVQWVVLAYLLAGTSLIVTVGRLGDMVGRRRLLLTGLLLFTTASGLCGSAPTLTLLIAGRAVQGLGAAIMMALAMAMAREAVQDDRVGRAMGLIATTSALGTALGPTLGGLLLEVAGWRAIFLVLAPAGAAAFLLVRRYAPADAAQTRPASVAFDKLGAALLTATLVAYALAMTLGRGSFGLGNIILLSVAAAGLALFVAVEARAASPLVRLSRFRDAVLSAALGANVVVSAVMMSTLVIGPFYLFRVLDLGPAGIGLVMSVGPALVAILGIPAGRMADRLGGRPASLLGLAIIVAGCVTLALAPASFGVGGYLVPIAVITLGYALFQTSNNLVVMTRASREEGGAISGMLNLSRNLGLISGASVMAAIFAAASGTTELSTAPPEAVAAGMRISFAVAAAMVAAAFIPMVRRRSHHPKAVAHA